ncbi:MAG: hypothetical protein Q9M10_03575 [Mariprofundaceae bacterium]|nr:hypothetical protein [Mariprofundaceae bacterium]
MNLWLIIFISLALAACAAKPPIQEMAAARSSLHMAHQLTQASDMPMPVLKSAETALKEAAQAIQKKRYKYARTQALKAKHDAQQAVKILQKKHTSM